MHLDVAELGPGSEARRAHGGAPEEPVADAVFGVRHHAQLRQVFGVAVQ